MIKTTIPFLRYRFFSIGISLILIIAGFVLTFVQGGFNLSVDFQAGLSMRFQISGDDIDIQDVRSALEELGAARIQAIGLSGREFSVQVKDPGTDPAFNETMPAAIQSELEKDFGTGNIRIVSSDFVDSRLSSDTVNQSFMLTSIAIFLILAYVWFRFKFSYAVAAIVATLHDVLFMVVVIGTFQIEVSTATIAAILTIIGYSLNDTIVVFDRIRENAEIMRDASDEVVINSSITTTLSRTIITSLTTVFAVVAIYVFTTGTVQNFALNLIIGIVVGTYSSIFIASPIMLALDRSVKKGKKDREAKKFGVHASASLSVKKEIAPAPKKEIPAESDVAEEKSPAPEKPVPGASKPAPSRTKKRKK